MSLQEKKRVLIITNELTPYLEITDFAEVLNKLAVKTFDSGTEIRIIMPKFGTINERRHRLHEVVRLSGINIAVGRDEHPLLIKVASLPNARLQVYFMDNEDFFKRKKVFEDEHGDFFEDNDERMIFFCKSALEIVKKFGWPPDVIHCHGWMSSLIPMFLKTVYNKEPVFANSKTIFTAQKPQFEGLIGSDFSEKVLKSLPALEENFVEEYKENDNEALTKGAIEYADVVIQGDVDLDREIQEELMEAENKLFVPYDEEWQESVDMLYELYENLVAEEI